MLSYKVTWSEEDEAYVATVDGPMFPSLSWIDPDPEEALGGLRTLLASEMNI